MKKRPICLLTIITVATITLLAACSTSDSASSTGETSSNETADTEEKNESSEEPVTTEEPVTITFQTWNPSEGEALTEIITVFEEQNPDIKINFVFMPYSDHVEKLKVDLASGQGPDIYGMQTGATINEFRDFEMDLTTYAQESWGNDWESGFVDFCMDLLNEDGHYYGLPLGLTYAGFAWADVNMLSEYDLEVPKTLEDLKYCSEILRENGQYPLAIGAKDDWINIDTWMSIANDINSEKLYSAIDGETSFTDADLIESFKIWQTLFTDGIVQDGALGVNVYTDTTDLFQSEGSIPMILNGSWNGGVYVSGDEAENRVFNSEGANHDVFLIDWNNDGKVNPIAGSVDVALCMNKDTENPEAAWKFLDFMLHEGQDILVNKYFYYCPSRTDLELNVEGMNEDGMENLNYILEQVENNLGGYREIAYADLKQSIADNLKALALVEITPEKAGEIIEAASQLQKR